MSYISWWSPGWVARPLLLSLLSTRKSQQAATHPEQTHTQTHRQTRLPSRTPYPIAPRDQNTPLGTPSL